MGYLSNFLSGFMPTSGGQPQRTGLLGMGGFGLPGSPTAYGAGLLGGAYNPRAAAGSAIQNALLGAGQALMKGTGSTGSVLAQGLGGAATGAAQGTQDYMKNAYFQKAYADEQRQRQLESDAAEQAAQEKAARKDAIGKWISTQPPDKQDFYNQAPDMAEQAWANQVNPPPTKPPEEITRKEGDQVVTYQWDSASSTYKRVAAGDAFKKTPDTVVNNNQGFESEYDKEIGKQIAKKRGDISTAAMNATSSLGTLNMMDKLVSSPNFYSGWGGETLQGAKRFAVSIGADPNLVKDSETFSALAKQTAIEKMGGSLGTGFSNGDRMFVEGQVPSLSNTPEGNKKLIQVNRDMEKRKIEIARFASNYEKAHGRLDANFDAALAAWAEAHPTWPNAQENLGSGKKKEIDDLLTTYGTGG
jgi:hypothetical protein